MRRGASWSRSPVLPTRTETVGNSPAIRKLLEEAIEKWEAEHGDANTAPDQVSIRPQAADRDDAVKHEEGSLPAQDLYAASMTLDQAFESMRAHILPVRDFTREL